MDDTTVVGQIRVFLALPPLLADLTEAILQRDPHTSVTGRLDVKHQLSVENAVTAAREARPKVVLLGVGHSRTARFCEALLSDQPTIRIISVDVDGREASRTELQLQVTPLGELWPQRLVDAILDAAHRPWPTRQLSTV